MQIEHKTEKGTILFFLPPNGAYRFKMFPNYGFQPYLSYFVGSETHREYLDDVGFQLIGLTSNITEEQAKMMIDECKEQDFNGIAYNDYQSTSIHDTALDSLKSLMQHLQVYEVNKTGTEEEMKAEWQEAQSRTGKWIVLFKSNES